MKFVILFLVLFSLKSGTCQDINSLNLQLRGKWNWYLTHFDHRGQGNPFIDVVSCNCHKQIIFLEDNILEFYSNDSLKFKGVYSIEFFSFDTKMILRNDYISGEIRLRDDTLGIGAFGGCATLQYFTKIN